MGGSRHIIGIWVIIAANVTLAALDVPRVVNNLSVKLMNEAPAFNPIYQVLSFATPFFATVTVLSLGACLGLKRQVRWSPPLAAQWGQRAVFWTLLMRAIALIMLSSVVSNKSMTATLLFITGVIYFAPTLLALAGCLYLARLWPINRRA